MKMLIVTHKNIPYEFRFFESTRTVLIFKDGRFTYHIKFNRTFWKCSCPGARFHGKCWHVTMIGELKRQPSIDEPWALWAEEAERMVMERFQ